MTCSVTLHVASAVEPNAEAITGVLDNQGPEDIEYGAGYRFERQLPSGQWRELAGVYQQAAVAYILRPRQRREISFGFPSRSGGSSEHSLTEGRHRIKLPVRCVTAGSNGCVVDEFSVSKR